jgi:hypothetical protein
VAINVDADHTAGPTIPRPAAGVFSPPLSMVHRRRVTEAAGGWRDYRELREPPDVELWRRAVAHGHRIAFVPRLTGVKFPASLRRGVYRDRPAHQQEAWLARIDREPDLEIEALVHLVVGSGLGAWTGLSYRELLGGVVRETRRRIEARRRLPTFGLSPRPGQIIAALRRYKGLHEEAHDVARRAQGHPTRHE